MNKCRSITGCYLLVSMAEQEANKIMASVFNKYFILF